MKSFKEYKYDYGSPESVKLMKKVTPGQTQNEIVDPMDLRGRPKKVDPYHGKTKFGLKHPLHPLNIQKKKEKAKKQATMKKEAVYGNQSQRLSSPLQKMRQDQEKKDRDKDGKLNMMKGRSKKEAMSPADKAAHDKAIAAFKAKGGKIKKLKPGYAQGYHGKDDPGSGMRGMLDKGDSKAFGTRKKVKSMGEAINVNDAHTDAQNHSNGSMSVKKVLGKPSLIMKSYHSEKDGHAFAKKHGYKASNYVKTQAGSRMHLESKDPGEYDEEGLMMKDQLDIVMDAADDIYDTVSDNENLPEWCQNKITKAADYIDSVRDYLKSQKTTNEDTLPCNNPGCECDPCTCGPNCTCGNLVKEEINELSTDTLKRYHKKTQDHMSTALKTNDPAMKKKFGNRLTGSGRAYQRLKKRGEYKEGSGPTMADKIKKDNMKQSDKDKLLKIRQMLDREKKNRPNQK